MAYENLNRILAPIAMTYCSLCTLATLAVFVRTRMRLDLPMIVISIAYNLAFAVRLSSVKLGLLNEDQEQISLNLASYAISCTLYFFVFEMR